MAQPASVLLLSSCVEPVVVPRVPQVDVHTVRRTSDALEALAKGRYAAIVVDLELSSQRVLDALARLRDLAPITPILLIVRELSRLVLNAAQQQRCQVLAGPTEAEHVKQFIERATAAQRLSREQLRAGLAKLSRDHALDSSNADLLARTVGLDEVCRSEAVHHSPEEAHRLLRALLLKLNLRTVSGLDAQLLRCAVLARSPRPSDFDLDDERVSVRIA